MTPKNAPAPVGNRGDTGAELGQPKPNAPVVAAATITIGQRYRGRTEHVAVPLNDEVAISLCGWLVLTMPKYWTASRRCRTCTRISRRGAVSQGSTSYPEWVKLMSAPHAIFEIHCPREETP